MRSPRKSKPEISKPVEISVAPLSLDVAKKTEQIARKVTGMKGGKGGASPRKSGKTSHRGAPASGRKSHGGHTN